MPEVVKLEPLGHVPLPAPLQRAELEALAATLLKKAERKAFAATDRNKTLDSLLDRMGTNTQAGAQDLLNNPFEPERVAFQNAVEGSDVVQLGDLGPLVTLGEKIRSQQGLSVVIIGGSNANGATIYPFKTQIRVALSASYPGDHTVTTVAGSGRTSCYAAKHFNAEYEGPVSKADLVIFETVTNDAQTLSSWDDKVSCVESLLLSIRRASPEAAVVALAFPDVTTVEALAFLDKRPGAQPPSSKSRLERATAHMASIRALLNVVRSHSPRASLISLLDLFRPLPGKTDQLLPALHSRKMIHNNDLVLRPDGIHLGTLGCAFVRFGIQSVLWEAQIAALARSRDPSFATEALTDGPRLGATVPNYEMYAEANKWTLENTHGFVLGHDVVAAVSGACKEEGAWPADRPVSQTCRTIAAAAVLAAHRDQTVDCPDCPATQATVEDFGFGWRVCKAKCKHTDLEFHHCPGTDGKSVVIVHSFSVPTHRRSAAGGAEATVELVIELVRSFEGFGSALLLGWLVPGTVAFNEGPGRSKPGDVVAAAWFEGLWDLPISVPQAASLQPRLQARSEGDAREAAAQLQDSSTATVFIAILPLDPRLAAAGKCKLQVHGVGIISGGETAR